MYNIFSKDDIKNKLTLNDIAKRNYDIFCNWARLYCNNEINEKTFKQYLQSGDAFSNINPHVRKRIYELYFGYKFNYNFNTSKWESTKIVLFV